MLGEVIIPRVTWKLYIIVEGVLSTKSSVGLVVDNVSYSR